MCAVFPQKSSTAGWSIALASGQHNSGGQAGVVRIFGALRGSLLGSRERVVGLRRKFHAAGICRGIPQIHDLGAPLCQELSFIASGPNDDNWDWTHGFLEEIVRKGLRGLRSIYGLALHYYAWNLSRGRTKNWIEGKGDALKFEALDWYELMRQGDVMESLINGHWQIMGEI